MTRCDVDLLSRYVDAELTLPERRGVEVHLATCADCRSELAAIQRADGIIRSWASQPAPIPLSTEARIRASTERGSRLSAVLALGRIMPAALGSSIAALLVLVTVNAGIVNTPSVASRETRGPSRSVLEKRSAPLVDARRVSAMLGERAPRREVADTLHRATYNIE